MTATQPAKVEGGNPPVPYWQTEAWRELNRQDATLYAHMCGLTGGYPKNTHHGDPEWDAYYQTVMLPAKNEWFAVRTQCRNLEQAWKDAMK